jgi:hypothetical protein
MKELFASGAAQKCTFEQKVGDMESTGVVYIGNGKMRGDFESKSPAGVVQSHMIIRDNANYVWSDEGGGQGMKMAMTDGEVQAQENTNQQNQAVDWNQALGYECTSWGASESVFTLPQGVEFTDLSAMMKQMPKAGAGKMMGAQEEMMGNAEAGGSAGGYKAMQCAACDSAPDADSKAQCKAAIGC